VFDVSFGGKAEVPSVGILMMQNLGKEDEEFWSSGMTVDLITTVKGAGLIRVASFDDILNLDKKLSIKEKAEKLRVKYILTNTIKKGDDGFHLWSILENIEDGTTIFTNKFISRLDHAPQIVGKLAENILKTLKVSTKQDVMKAPTTNAEAYEFYLKAKYIHEKREDMQDTEISRGLYRKAIELDDNLIEAKTSLGWTYFETGDYDKAMDIYTSALKQAEELGNKSGIGASLKGIGDVHQIKGDYDNALDDYGRQFKILEELADKRGIGASLNNIGGVYFNKGDYEKALNYYERSLTILEEIDDKQGMGYNLNTIGIVYAYKGDHEKAIEYHERSLKIDEELGDKGGMGWSLNNIGDVYKSQGNYEKAMDYYERSLAIQEERGNKSWIGRSLIKIGNVHDIKSDHEKALDYYERSLKILEELGDKYGIGASLKSIGDLYSNKGDSAKALDYYNRSRKIKEELSNP
jgi:tetratricopeptide (TPR) repeat protein